MCKRAPWHLWLALAACSPLEPARPLTPVADPASTHAAEPPYAPPPNPLLDDPADAGAPEPERSDD
jgi:hypothetical protein